MLFKNRIKTNAAAIQEHLQYMENQKRKSILNEDLIELYPKQEEPNYYQESVNRKMIGAAAVKRRAAFCEEVKKELMYHCIFDGVMAPILEANLANTHEIDLTSKTVYNFITEQKDINDLIDKFKYKNYYLAEFAQLVEKYTDLICETADDKMKEGLSEKDAYGIENEKIDDFILNAKDVVPNDITSTIRDRVEDSINDFVDENKKNKFEIKKIYDKAKENIAMADGDNEVQQEELRIARRKERAITEQATNVFGAIVHILTESVYKVKSLQESYMNKSSNRVDFARVVGDAKCLFTFMEAMNTMNIIDADETYVKEAIDDLKSSMDDVVAREIKVSREIDQDDSSNVQGEEKEPKEEDQNPDDDNDNDPSNDQDQPSVKDDDEDEDKDDDDDDKKDDDDDDEDKKEHHHHDHHHHDKDDDDDD